MHNITNDTSKILSAPEFCFQLSKQAADFNWKIVEKYNSLSSAITAQNGTAMELGSEFRPISTLVKIFGLHPLWKDLSSGIESGFNYPLTPLSNEDRKLDLQEALVFGNHKGVDKHREFYLTLINKDVVHGYCLPFPLSKISTIPGAIVPPLNIAEQNTINERGEIIPSKRLTHNQSMVYKSSNTSVNSRVIKEKLCPIMYGHALLRLIHYIVACRRKFPNKKIMLSKFDLKSAYRRCHMDYDTAIQSVTQDPELDIAMLTLRLTFGGAPNPNNFSLVSESICDLANHLLQNEEWNHKKYFSPIQDKIPTIKTLSEDLPFEKSLPLIVDVPCDPRGHAEIYIDDFMVACVDIGDNNIRANKAVPLAIHVVGRPLLPLEVIPRKDLISAEKLEAEAGQSEIKRNLGWNINTRSLVIAIYRMIKLQHGRILFK